MELTSKHGKEKVDILKEQKKVQLLAQGAQKE
jgi:hypothetical protein